MVADLAASIVTTIFLLYVLSYYVLLFLPQRREPRTRRFSSITIIIPARNEAPYLRACIASVLAARFKGTKQVIVIDDASIDETACIARSFGRRLMLLRNTTQLGKAASMNKALKRASGELIAVVDGDSVIAPDALEAAAREAGKRRVAAVAAVVKVKNRRQFVNPWVHIELVYNSLIRALFSKVNANIVTPGALSVYRADALREIGGFSTEGFSEDVDVAIRLIRAGYRVGFAEDAIAETNMPPDPKGFFRQRMRMARGMINILKRHLEANKTVIDLYTLPLFLFWYVQAVIMGSITLYQLWAGYVTYFASKGVYVSLGVLKFFFEWFSIVGFVRWTWHVATGIAPLTFLAAVGIASTLLSYPLFLYALWKYDGALRPLHLLAFCFMFPFWLLIMVIYIMSLPELFRTEQYNRWKKNEP
ncbi:glycosyltransferase family 2 protein [Candidatus Woesearchaeota archaeon]|nr:MAG: glycosyltransferase family 2 protein [Candidatus Woesearchaeota archaeon]